MTAPCVNAWRPSFDTPALRPAWDTVRLAETIDHAYRHVRRYREAWDAAGISPAAFESLSDLARFAPTRKAAIAADPMAFVSDADTPDAIHDTSGTTGRRLPVYSNAAEEDALGAVAASRSAAGVRPALVLRLLPPPRRLVSQRRSTQRQVPQLRLPVLPGYDPGIWSDAVDQVADIVFDRFLVEGRQVAIDVIHVTPPPLLGYLSEQLVARGVDPAQAGVAEIVLTGGHVTPAARAVLARTWRARVASSYSCTEIRGDSPECLVRPGVFHPSPSVFAEVLDPETLEAVPDGAHGLVALTGLYPFQRVMPMIRYLPGDIAECIAGPCVCGANGTALRIIGRASHVVDVSDAVGYRYFLGSGAIQDAIGDCVHVPRFPYPRIAATRTSPTDGPVALIVEIEATCPRGFDVAGVEARLAAAIGGDPVLERTITDGRLTVTVRLVEKGALADFFRLYPGR